MYGWRPIKQILPPMNKVVQVLIYDQKIDKHYVSAGMMTKQEGSYISFVPVDGVSTLEILPVVAWCEFTHPDTTIKN